VIENKGGANGIVAAEQMSKQPPDGYTFMQVAAGMLTINQSIYKSLPYDPIDGFTPLTIAVSMPLILVVNNAQPIKSVADLIALARAKPGTLTYGSSGVGTSMHLGGAMFEVMAKVSMVHVPYRGGAPAMNDLLGNQVTALFDNAPTALAQIRAGTVRAVAVGGNARLAELPNVPTIAESGLPGYNSDTWYGFVMPPKASPQVANGLHASVVAALADSKQKLEGLGFTLVASSASTMHDTIRSESAKWADVIRRSGIERQ
ncbi:MAG TPA: tripartite tricarboxylate transporter substrate-binding protein, partial [Burkholderiaceae bacterium]